jgi:tetratricopeptide (TPR) repeat protein
MSSLIPSNINIENINVEDINIEDCLNNNIINESDKSFDKSSDKSSDNINNFNINYAQLETLLLHNLLNLSNLPEPKKGVSLCLNMIVRNESKIIKRLLISVLPIIDTYVICDTGSTDDTVSIIKDFFNSRGISGEVIYEPFKNFGYNRTFALKAARGKATYALLLDADMIFKIEPSFNKEVLTADSYLIIQKGSGLSYHNTRLIKLNIDAKCVGPTHEYYDLPSGSQSDKLDSIWIDDIGDGGSKADKFERDIRLLKQGIEEEPNNGRYYFYLANSYFNTGRHEESIQYYKKRIEIGGWVEEVFYSHLNLGHAYMTTKQDEIAIFTWMNAYNNHSVRSETIYEICKYYRLKGMNKIAMAFCMLGKSIPYPKNDTLFIHNDVYETGFDYELSVIGYYNNYPNIHKIICKLMNNSKQSYSNHLSNYKFYCPKLSSSPYLIKQIGGIAIKDTIDICGTTYQMNASNPCIFTLGNRYKINIRFVNYLLNRNGTYHFDVNDGKIATVNQIFNLDEEFNLIGEPEVFIPETNNLRYVGMEDLKLFPILKNNRYYNHDCAFIGTCENPVNNRISMGYGKITLDGDLNYALKYKVVNTPYNKNCEKNWVFYNDSNGEINVIYQWYPLTIGKINENKDESNPTLEIKQTKDMPPYFQNVRGSSNGCEYADEMWFLCHIVEYCQPREYYHFFAVFDKNTMDIKRWSHLFKFEGEKIEYALGLIVEEKRIIISYSKWDSDPTIGLYDKEKVEKEMF